MMNQQGMIGGFKDVTDFQRESEEFEARKRQRMLEEQMASGKLSMLPYEQQKMQAEVEALKMGKGLGIPATIQIANEMQRAKEAGDVERFNLLNTVHKTMDRGVTYDQFGNIVPMSGYGSAVGSIAGTKAGLEQQGKKDVDIVMDPRIAGLVAREQQAAKNAADLAATQGKRAVQSNDNMSVINDILLKDSSGIDILDKATGSGAGAIYAGGKQFFGKSDESTQSNAQLQVYAGKLLNNVPRMEGPQSDADLKSYKEQAGKIGDPTIPAGDKRAALAVIQQLSEKYAGNNSVSIPQINEQSLYDPAQKTGNIQPPSSGIQVDGAAPPVRGEVIDGYMFNGGDPANPQSWKKVR